jgi:hypothetical protein
MVVTDPALPWPRTTPAWLQLGLALLVALDAREQGLGALIGGC